MPKTLDLNRAGRDLAVRHLKLRGYTVLARDAQTRHGVLDIVAVHGADLAFVAVSTLRSGQAARPMDEQQMRRRASAWLAQSPRPRATEIHFVAINVVLDTAGRLVRLDHLD